jgi:hypothetical protein
LHGQEHKKEISENKKKYYGINRQSILDSRKVFRTENRDRLIEKDRKYYEETRKAKYEENKEEILEIQRLDRIANPEKYKEFERRRRANQSLDRKIGTALRGRLVSFLNGQDRVGSAVRDLGQSIEEFKTMIESLWWPTMGWGNRGSRGWHLDHVVPLNEFDLTNLEQFKVAVHHSNYQPLWYNDNESKAHRLDWTPFKSKHELPSWYLNDPTSYQARVDFVLDKLSKVRLKKAA